jgi:hypothetical protein
MEGGLEKATSKEHRMLQKRAEAGMVGYGQGHQSLAKDIPSVSYL